MYNTRLFFYINIKYITITQGWLHHRLSSHSDRKHFFPTNLSRPSSRLHSFFTPHQSHNKSIFYQPATNSITTALSTKRDSQKATVAFASSRMALIMLASWKKGTLKAKESSLISSSPSCTKETGRRESPTEEELKWFRTTNMKEVFVMEKNMVLESCSMRMEASTKATSIWALLKERESTTQKQCFGVGNGRKATLKEKALKRSPKRT